MRTKSSTDGTDELQNDMIAKLAEIVKFNLRNITIFSLNNSCLQVAESAQYRQKFLRFSSQITFE